MDAQDLRKLLEQTDDKLSIFTSKEILDKANITTNEYLNLISEFLSDEEKSRLFDYPYYNQCKSDVKRHIIGLVSDDQIKLQMLNNDNFFNGIDKYDKSYIIERMSDNVKQQILYNQDFLNKNLIDKNSIKTIISSLTDEEAKEKILMDKEFCVKNDIHPYKIIKDLESEEQKDFIKNIENINLTLNEKREILAILKTDVKKSIDTTNFPKEYKIALNMETTENGIINTIDFEKNLEDYRGLDNLMYITAEDFTEEQRAKFIKLCDICPNLKVFSKLDKNLLAFSSTGSEYKEGEEWIKSIIDNLNPEYSKAQKMAVIDNAIGKKISYSPDFDTEVFDFNDCRALWKIISSGYGVCNGVADVEQYILNRVGIDSERISSGRHAFLKIKDIELPLANGEIARGNTILDPTWNLANHRFGAKPGSFCISYEQARKNDIDSKGKDHNIHKNDEQLQDATLNLDEQSLRKLFASVGLADRDGQFPIIDVVEKSKQLDETYADQPEQNINKQFELLSKCYPEFATCQNSSMRMLSEVFLNNENLKFNKCVVDRVYNRKDEEKRPIMYVYIDSNELGKKFYYANKDEGQMVRLTQEEFTQQFECYEKDLENNNFIRPWETKEQIKEDIDLSRSSGNIVAEEGQER